MARYIDADETIELLKGLGSRDYRREKGTICEAIKMLQYPEYTPTADVVPKSEVEATVEKLMSATDKVICEAKADVAREIFALIYDRLLTYFPAQSFIDAPCTTHDRIFDMLDELQKKYTEDE